MYLCLCIFFITIIEVNKIRLGFFEFYAAKLYRT